MAHLNNTFLLDRTSYVGSEDAIRLLELSCHLELSLSDLLVYSPLAESIVIVADFGTAS